MRDVRVLLVSGSTRSGSTNTAALRTAVEVTPPGVDALLYDRLVEIPAFDPDQGPAGVHPSVADLRRAVAMADAVLFCTPEYAGNLPGSLKNLLDWLVGSGELYEKPVAWINVAAPNRGGGAHTALAGVLSYVAAVVVEPACVRLQVPREVVGPDGSVTDEAIRAGIARVLRTLADNVKSE
jgi:chromate reductase